MNEINDNKRKISVKEIQWPFNSNRLLSDLEYRKVISVSGEYVCVGESWNDPNRGGTKKSITSFTPASAIRLQRKLCELEVVHKYMVTLTFPSANLNMDENFMPESEWWMSDGVKVKKIMKLFLDYYKRKVFSDLGYSQKEITKETMDIEKYSIVWFLEFQKRGAPHFHFFATHVPSDDWVKSMWYKVVGSNQSYHYDYGTHIRHPTEESLTWDDDMWRKVTSVYARKYATKTEDKSYQKIVPLAYQNCGRFWGVHGYHKVLKAKATVYERGFRAKHCSLVDSYLRILNQYRDRLASFVYDYGQLRVIYRYGDLAPKKLQARVAYTYVELKRPVARKVKEIIELFDEFNDAMIYWINQDRLWEIRPRIDRAFAELGELFNKNDILVDDDFVLPSKPFKELPMPVQFELDVDDLYFDDDIELPSKPSDEPFNIFIYNQPFIDDDELDEDGLFF